MDEKELILMLGQLQGSVEATKENINNKFDTIHTEIKEVKHEVLEIKKENTTQNNRITTLEVDKKVVMKLASIFGAVFGVLTTAIISIGSSIVQFFFAHK